MCKFLDIAPSGTKNIPVVVVGNKVDLDDERQIQYEDAKNWVSTSMANAAYLETSAKYNINVKELFKQLLVCTYGFSAEDKVSFRKKKFAKSDFLNKLDSLRELDSSIFHSICT